MVRQRPLFLVDYRLDGWVRGRKRLPRELLRAAIFLPRVDFVLGARRPDVGDEVLERHLVDTRLGGKRREVVHDDSDRLVAAMLQFGAPDEECNVTSHLLRKAFDDLRLVAHNAVEQLRHGDNRPRKVTLLEKSYGGLQESHRVDVDAELSASSAYHLLPATCCQQGPGSLLRCH